MRLHRFALILFDRHLSAVHRWGYVTREGVNVQIDSFKESSEPVDSPNEIGYTFLGPAMFSEGRSTEILLHADATTGFEIVHPLQIKIDDEARAATERALSEMAGILGVLSEHPWSLVSPRPYIWLSGENAEEETLLSSTRRVVLPSQDPEHPLLGAGLGRPIPLAQLLEDRPDGVLLLGAAVRAGSGIAKIHELFRVLENGFSRAGRSLIDPLTEFLQSYPEWDLGYTREEVRFWVEELRHPATHADLSHSKRILYDSDVDRHLFRIEQAAYDVLFNKLRWNRADTKRQLRWAFTAASLPDGGSLVSPGAFMRTSSPLDHFGAFPLRETYRLNIEDSGSRVGLWADWYFSEEDWKLFGEAR